MSKKTENVTPELLREVEAVLADAANHKYSVSRVYGAHNQVFQLAETPESCASCLRKRADALKRWYADHSLRAIDAQVKAESVEVDTIFGKAVVSPELAEIAAASANTDYTKEVLCDPGAPTLNLKDKEGNYVEAVLNVEAGTLTKLDGKAVKPGTYTTEVGETYAVQPGGKATLKDDLL